MNQIISLKTGSRTVVGIVSNGLEDRIAVDDPLEGKATPDLQQSSLWFDKQWLGLKTNASTMPAGKPPSKATDDPVYAAKQNTVAAQKMEKEAAAKKQLEDNHVKAKAMSEEARARSKDAFAAKATTPSGRKAHATAAMAHTDASSAYGKLASATSGNDLDTRGKCQGMCDKHKSMAERHTTISEGMNGLAGRNTMNTGSNRVVVNVGMEIGEYEDDFPEAPLLVENAWSDAARQAAAESRKSGGSQFGNKMAEKADEYTEDANHVSRRANKGKVMLGGRVGSSEDHNDAHEMHLKAAAKHEIATKHATDATKPYHQAMVDYHKQRAERHGVSGMMTDLYR